MTSAPPANELPSELPELAGSALVDENERSLPSSGQEAPKGGALVFFESDGADHDVVENRWEPLLRDGGFSL